MAIDDRNYYMDHTFFNDFFPFLTASIQKTTIPRDVLLAGLDSTKKFVYACIISRS